MKVFLSWSGERSKRAAEILKTWLPDVLQALDPWVSSRDILKGSRGSRDIANELEGANFGIICVTTEGQKSQWINFEAGALSKQIDEAYVVPFLIDLKPSDLTGPLAQFQATSSDNRDDTLKLVLDLNTALGDAAIPPDRVRRTFERNWPDLDQELEEIRKIGSGSSQIEPRRPQSDIIEEMLLLMRQQERRLADIEGRLAHSMEIESSAQNSQRPLFGDDKPARRNIGPDLYKILRRSGLTLKTARFRGERLQIIVEADAVPAAVELDRTVQSIYKMAGGFDFNMVSIEDTGGRILAEYPF
ncbi:toll/interleukin-1 receptor domain-containing protein [Kitasatospora purpeofusca]|uniref:toll/interleukin-1 receptor domain-containing protein n=1 Tax=Kitasatospora purpeofusca TaxID=67352 RepID=UPI0035D68BB9